jgi:hypothetical protein
VQNFTVLYRDEALSFIMEEGVMSAIEKSIERHRHKLAKKKPEKKQKVPWGCGLGWPEPKDFPTYAAYVAARKAADPDYTPNHDGRLWLIV